MKRETRRARPKSLPVDLPSAEPRPTQARRPLRTWIYPLLVVASFMLGLLVSDQAWGRQPHPPFATAPTGAGGQEIDLTSVLKEVNPPEGYILPISYGDLGPRLIQSGAIDYERFAAVYTEAGDALTESQIRILKQGSSESVRITSEDAHFLLNFFWAVGLANQNPVLTAGPMAQYGSGRIDSFASTGGWTLGAKPVAELFAGTKLIELSSEHQARVEEVAAEVYRPCCDNPTLFPDCNHGMAMLGLLELMASRDASINEMLTAAKYVNAFWFPQQAVETAIYLRATQHVSFSEADSRTVTGSQFSSGSGASQMHAELQAKGLLPQAPDGGRTCGT